MSPLTQVRSLPTIPRRRDRRHCTGGDIAGELIRASLEVGDETDHAAQDTCCRRHPALCDLSSGRAPGLEQESILAENDRHWLHLCFWPGSRLGRADSRFVSLRLSERCAEIYPIPRSFASAFHLLSTSAFVFASIRISSGHGRLKPSAAHLRVASMPIFDP